MIGMDVNDLDEYPGRLGLQQRVLPAYRAAFFDLLARSCRHGLGVFAGQPQADEQIVTVDSLQGARYFSAHNRYLMRVGSPFFRCWQDGIVDWLEDWQPQALVVEANPRYPSTPRAVRWMHERRRPVLGWGLGAPPIHGWLAPWRKQARLDFLFSLDALIAYSRRGAEEYRSLGFPSERIFVAPNAVTPRPTRPPPERPATYGERPGVIFIGRLQMRKRVDNLLRACAALPEPLQPRLWVVGDGPARPEFQTLAQAVYPRAEFTGARHGTELENLLAAADLFVLPGTGGLAVQQAMAHGLPVIVAQGDGTQDDLVREGNGWIIPEDDLEALTQAMLTALADLGRLRSMGAASYRLVLEEANLEAMVRVFLSALASVGVGEKES
jgi:glycosyltransferase involved in cell wall biosynthesis